MDMKVLPHSRYAYAQKDEDRTPLFDLLAEEGGAWVWGHDNGYQIDYFVGDKKVLQYFVKPYGNQTESDALQNRTIVGKQWVSKDILEKRMYEYQEYGEGSYAITGKLEPVSLWCQIVLWICETDRAKAEVQELHKAASSRTEDLLRRLAVRHSTPKPTPQKTQTKAIALFSFQRVQDDELPFEKGDILECEPLQNDAWWPASLNGRKGLIPKNYVRIMTDDEPAEDEARDGEADDDNSSQQEDKGDGKEDKNGKGGEEEEKEIKKMSWFDKWKAKFDNMRRDAREPRKRYEEPRVTTNRH